MTRLRLGFGVVALAGACAVAAPEEQRLAHRAAAAMGGMDRVRAVRSLLIEGSGASFELGQGVTIDGEMFHWRVDEYRRALDLAGGRWREESVQTPSYRTQSYRSVQAYADGVAFDEDAGRAKRLSAAVAMNRRASLYHHPVGFLQAIDDPGSRVEHARSEEGHELVDLVLANGERYTLALDAQTGTPVRIVSTGHDPVLGDVQISTEFGDFADADGLTLPRTLKTSVDGKVILDLRVTTSIDAETPSLEVPADARVPEESIYTVTVKQVAPGVWYLAGERHHSVVVEFAGHLTLIEAPDGEGRTLAVIAAARALRPGKPLTQLVNTHHHFDHAAGLRAAIAEGMTIITHEGNREFYRQVASRPSTFVRDGLARAPRPLQLETVGDRKVIGDDTRTMELYPIQDSPHSSSMVMAYLPAERLLIEADAYQPPPPSAPPQPGRHPFARNLLDNIEARGLRIDRVLPLHGCIVPFSDLVAAVRGTAVPRTATEQHTPGTIASRRMADGKEWTTANLSVDASPSYCYDDAESNCRRYGRLYTWASAQQACRSLKGGWRLPTDDEWRRMAKHYGGVSDDSADKGGAAFTALVSGGTSRFDVVMGGNRADGKYARLEAHGLYWTASDNDPRSAPFYNFGKNGRALHRQPQGEKQMAISVRCVRE